MISRYSRYFWGDILGDIFQVSGVQGLLPLEKLFHLVKQFRIFQLEGVLIATVNLPQTP